eukprot:51301-Chlamydomonas_euryale.AAC.4
MCGGKHRHPQAHSSTLSPSPSGASPLPTLPFVRPARRPPCPLPALPIARACASTGATPRLTSACASICRASVSRALDFSKR